MNAYGINISLIFLLYYNLMDEFSYINEALFHLDKFSGFNTLNHRLVLQTLANERRIQAHVERINRACGLHLKQPIIVWGFEIEFLSEQPLNVLLETPVQGNEELFVPSESTVGGILDTLGFDITLESNSKLLDDKRYNKYEIRSKKPRPYAQQLAAYSALFTLLDIGRDGPIRRYSQHANFSIVDAASPGRYPFYNGQFRDLLGKNAIKFVDEALVLLDSKNKIELQLPNEDASDHVPTDIMGYSNNNSDYYRCCYQVAYRNHDMAINADNTLEPLDSTARHELRRTYPGESKHHRSVCDPIVSACAVITASVAHSFEVGKAEELSEYRYRGTDYSLHNKKFNNSALLKEYLGKDLVEKLADRIHTHNVDSAFLSLLGGR